MGGAVRDKKYAKNYKFDIVLSLLCRADQTKEQR